MSKETNQDMGTGSVKKLMVQMAVPAVVGQVINLLYNVVDRIYIGHIPEIGGAALTGVGLFTPILMLITAFAMLAGAAARREPPSPWARATGTPPRKSWPTALPFCCFCRWF